MSSEWAWKDNSLPHIGHILENVVKSKSNIFACLHIWKPKQHLPWADCPPWHWTGMQERKSDPRSRASAPGWFVASPYYCRLDCLLARLSNLRCQLLCSSVSKLSWQDNTSYVEIICMSLLLNASLHNNTSDKEVYYRVFGLGAWKRLSHTQIHTEAVTNTQTHRHTDTQTHTHNSFET